MSLEGGINKIILRGHKNVHHTPDYHQYILDRLRGATNGLRPGSLQYKTALERELEYLRGELIDHPDMIGWTGF